MKLEDLTSEQQEKAKECKTPEEILALAEEEGFELSDEEIEQVSGGTWGGGDEQPKCPYCGSADIYCYSKAPRTGPGMECGDDWECRSCGATWTR